MVLAFGSDGGPLATQGVYDFKPLIASIVAVLVVVPFVLRVRLTWVTGAIAFAAGTLWGWMVDAWGVVPPTALAMLALAITSSVVDRRRRS